MNSWAAEHWLGLNWTLSRWTLQIEARHPWNLLEVKKFLEGGLCTYHTSSVSPGNRILHGGREAEEAGLKGSRPSRSDFCCKPCCLPALDFHVNLEQKRMENCGLLHLNQTVEPLGQEISCFFHRLRRERPLPWRLSSCHHGNHQLGLTGFVLSMPYCLQCHMTASAPGTWKETHASYPRKN